MTPFMTRDERDESIVVPLLADWFRKRTCAEVESIGRAQRVPLSAVRSVREVAGDPQLAHREFFTPIAGAAMQLAPARLWRSNADDFARRAGSDGPLRGCRRTATSTAVLPLDGVRGLDLGQVWAGPYAAMLLADQGADVIKVESPSRGTRTAAPCRQAPAAKKSGGTLAPTSRSTAATSARSVWSSAHPRGREVLAALVRRSDVVIENYRAGVMERLGIGYDWLRAQRADMILVSMAAFGQTGPDPRAPRLRSRDGAALGDRAPDRLGRRAPSTCNRICVWRSGRRGRGGRCFARRAAAPVRHRLRPARRSRPVRCVGRDDRRSVRRVEHRQVGAGAAGQLPSGLGSARRVSVPRATTSGWRSRSRPIPSGAACSPRCTPPMEEPEWARADPPFRHRSRRTPGRTASSSRNGCRRGRAGAPRPRSPSAARPRRPGSAGRAHQPRAARRPPAARARILRTGEPPGGRRVEQHGWEWRPAGAGRCVRRVAPDFASDNAAILREAAGLSDAEIAALAAEGVIGTTPIGVPPLPRRSQGVE